jgi:galactokinase/galacturonokinase
MKTYCPYRIAPLGAHIDHQYGVVCGCAINLGIHFNYKELNSNEIILTSNNYESEILFNINDDLNKNKDWADYFRGIIKYIKNKYIINKGLKGYFKGDLPPGGISSSSSSQIAFLLAICNVNNIKLSKNEIIDIVYKVEREFMNLSVGILDPSCEVLSKQNSLLFLDTLTNYQLIIENDEFSNNYQFVVIYSGVKRNLINSKYNQRVNELKSCYNKLDIEDKFCNKLRDIPNYYFDNNKNKLNEIELKRGTHYFTEMDRVKKGLQAWRNNDINTFGKLMNESCLSSINNYESGSNYLIDLFNITKDIDGVLGIRFLGAGFNGSSLALVKKDKLEYIENIIKEEYLSIYPELKNSFEFIPVKITDGVDI